MDTASAVPVVLETLRNACCQNADVLKPAEKQLQSWETQPGFYTILSEIFCNHSIDTNVRWLAVLYCKNGVDRYWRRNAPNAIAEEEKDSLKVRLLSNFNEPVPQIATQLAVLIAKIARYDCPRNWSQLLPTLFEAVRHPEELLQQRALLVLHHVTKTIASKRLASDRKLFEDLTKEIFGFISSLWIRNVENFQQLAFKHDNNMINALDKSILTCKILRKQIAFGFKEPGENEEVVNFLNQIFTRLKEMLDCRRTMWGHHQILEKCEKMITLLSKILLDLLEMHPVTFVRLIQPTLQFTTTYNFSHTEKELVFERFTVNCFNLIKGILLNDMYRPTKNTSDIVEPIRSEAHRIKMEFFTFDTLSEVCRRLVSEYFLFSNDDLNTWDTDPEEFCQEEGGDSYKYSLRSVDDENAVVDQTKMKKMKKSDEDFKTKFEQTKIQLDAAIGHINDLKTTEELLQSKETCYIQEIEDLKKENKYLKDELDKTKSALDDAQTQNELMEAKTLKLKPSTECLFLTLFKEFRTSLSPVLLDIVRSLQGPCDPDDLMTILRKDAVYNAVGLAAFDLFDDISFDEWFTTHLMQELQNKHVNYRIIRRRVIWLCGQWVGVKMSASLRPTLYQVIIPLLDKEEDLVVRLEAAITLKTAVDDFEFSTEQFLPFLETSFTLLFELLKEVHECDTKMQVLHVISFVIERVGSQIRPYTSSLMQYLPALWQESADHNMLKCAILTTLIHLVQGFSSHCTEMYEFLLPIIQMSTDVSQDQHVYLMEDGLELWQVTLHNSPVITDKLLELYKNMPGLLELGTENLRICLKVIEAYIYFCPHDFMQQFSQELVTSLGSLMNDIRTEGLVLILRVIELVFKTFPSEGPEVFQPLLPKLFNSLLDEEEHPVVLTMYVTLFARILLQNQDYMWTFLNRISTDLNKDSKSLLGRVIDTFVDKIDNMAQPEKRKLVALAVASLLSVNVSTVMDKFAAIINICVEVLHDVTRIPVDEDTVLQMDSLVITDQDDNYGDDNSEEETEHDKRKRLLLKKDPVHTIPLKDFLISQLSACQQLHGQVTFNGLMEQVDTEITRQLHEFATSF